MRSNISFELSLLELGMAQDIFRCSTRQLAKESPMVAQLNSSLTRDTGYHGQ